MNVQMRQYQKNKKILIVSHGIGGGGAQRVTTMLANGFATKGYLVHIVTTAPSEETFELIDGIKYDPIVATQKISVMRTLFRIKELKRHIKSFHPDYILSLSAIPNMLTIIARGFRKIDIVVSERTDPSKHPSNMIAIKVRNILYHIPKAIVFQTVVARDYFKRSIRKKGMIIPNAVFPGLPQPYEGKRKKEIVGMGALSDQKDWMTSIKAFELFVQEHPDYRLTIYGDGVERKMIEEYINSRKLLKGKIFLPGFVSDIHEKIKDSMVFVSSAVYDGISNSILEAMAMGLPCVCTDTPTGGARFLIHNHKNGVLVPVGDYYALYQEIKNIVEDDDLRKIIRKNAILIREKFDYASILEQWEKIVIYNAKTKSTNL